MTGCPGQDFRKLTVSYHPCPTCGKAVEFFSDEMQTRCRNCKTVVSKEQAPTCIQWCKAARQCIGAERYDEIMKLMQEAGDGAEGGTDGAEDG